MKHMRKLLVLVMALAMVLSMGVNAFADDPVTYTITAPATNHQYEIYQIFTGDLSGDVLSNVKWGANGKEAAGSAVDKSVLTQLEGLAGKTDAQKLEVITPLANLTGTPVATITNGESYNAAPGYYLIKDKDGTVEEGAYTTYLVKLVKAITIAPKADTPTSEKEIVEGTATMESADYSVGDEITYRLTATLPDDEKAFEGYKTYFVNFVDTISKGLTYKAGSATLKVGDAEAAPADPTITDYTGTEDAYENGKVLTWNIADVKALGAKAGDTIVIEYKATLNEDAVVGNPGNPNKMHIEFDNNPNPTQDGTPEPPGTTPDDKTVAFTYKVVANKVDQDEKPLSGAEFTLTKKGDTTPIAVVKSDDGTAFTFSGLGDGEYTLTETKTPAGYNTMEAINFTISSTTTVDGIQTLTGNGPITFVSNTAEGSLTTDVVNQKGATLPETGGMGTTVFYIVGGLLVAGAAVVLITRRRMDSEK